MNKCPKCGEEKNIIGVEYEYNHPNHYDGISEYHCPCGCRWGRFTGKVLQLGEYEKNPLKAN